MASNSEKSVERNSDISFAAESLESFLDNSNNRILRHREWLASHSQNHDSISTITNPPSYLVTAPPYLTPRQTAPAGCNDISALAFGAGESSASSAFSESLSSASVAIVSLSSVLAGAEASASAALNSATNSMLMAQISMNSVLSLADKSASMIVVSAAEMVASANAAVSEAKIKATNQIQKADASISAANQAAEASIVASQTAAMNSTKFALSLTFAIFGSSLISIVLFYLIMRERQYKKEQRQARLKEKIHLRNTTRSPFLETDMPDARLNARRSAQLNQEHSGYDLPAESSSEKNAQRHVVEVKPDGSSILPILKLNNNELVSTQSIECDTGEVTPNSLKRRYTEGYRRGNAERIKQKDKYKTYNPTSTVGSLNPMLQYDPDRQEYLQKSIENNKEEAAPYNSQMIPRQKSSKTFSSHQDGVSGNDNTIGAAI